MAMEAVQLAVLRHVLMKQLEIATASMYSISRNVDTIKDATKNVFLVHGHAVSMFRNTITFSVAGTFLSTTLYRFKSAVMFQIITVNKNAAMFLSTTVYRTIRLARNTIASLNTTMFHVTTGNMSADLAAQQAAQLQPMLLHMEELLHTEEAALADDAVNGLI